ncbi:dihydrolipoyl dehydrogenase [Maribellus maritimus]|uniref:dihydrolipoyl dehydrogenase n=1 Tax=Maribellus maritimus TaxID=2870838 RepID=UPI001EEBD988|nr:dihydrolipoyl dehydrogenase [Maribellus maritimus]MCG6187101.1 dihydrolipoyl dehydrogenase [Maribellus maritimus]
MSTSEKHKLVIIGAGPGGYRAAFMAADLGLDVTLIDSEVNPGGVCLYRGCIPTKALLHLARIKADAEHAGDLGIHFDKVRVNTEEVGKWKTGVVKKLTGGLGQLVKARKINYVRGKATFLDSETIQIETNEGDKKEITFENAIVATGAKPIELPGIDMSNPKIMHSAQSLELKDIPNKMLVVGGGYIGLEMAVIYKSLGTEITVVELTDDLMPGMDKDLVHEFKKVNKNTFKEILPETKLKTLREKGEAIEADFEDAKKKKFSKTYDKVLVSVGQNPNSRNIGLENTSVGTDEKGFIKVNKRMQTTQKNIYAIGDVAGPPLLAHKASYEGKVAAEVIAGKKSANDAKAIPAVIYTEPEIAVCGLSEKEAKEKGISYKVVKFPWPASGRAIAMNEKSGFTKLLVNPDNERILGAGIVGRNAGDMIAEIALAIEMAATAEDVALTIHPHPTLSETIMEAAEMFYGHPAHTFIKK